MRPNSLLCAIILLIVVMTIGCAMLREEFRGETWEPYAELANKAKLEQQYGLAAENYRRAVDELVKEGSHGGWVAGFLSNIYEQQGKYDQAIEAGKASLQTSLEFKDYNGKVRHGEIAEHYCWLADIYQAQGKFDDALKNYELASSYADQVIKDPWNSHFKVNLITPYMGKYNIQTGNYERAKQYLQEALATAENLGYQPQHIAIAKNNLGLAYYCAGDELAAEKLYTDAGGLNTHAVVAFPQDLAVSLTMLGRIAEHRRENGKALTYYQSALDVLRRSTVLATQATKEHRAFEYKVEQADIFYQVGRFQFRQGHLNEAILAYNEACRLRLASQTQTHPNYGDVMRGLAGVAASNGELTSATLQAEKALKILDASVVPTHPHTAPNLVALASLYTLNGHPDQAAPLFARLDTILQKPLGPWTEDFLETTNFYSGILNKAGQTDAAKHLEQLRAHQKEQK